MSILGKIISTIFGHASAAPAGTPAAPAGTPAAPAAPSAPAAAPSSAPASPAAKPTTPVDVADVLTKLAAKSKEKLDWRHSIVDLMKLLNLDSSLAARKELAGELHYTGDTNDSATMNIWLHKQVMQKLADNGGKVPDELRK
jgi:3-oxoacyl-ACP reductase-like protein